MSKNIHAVALGKKGGKARMEALTKEERTKLGLKSVAAKKLKKLLEEKKVQKDEEEAEATEFYKKNGAGIEWENNHAYEKENGK